MAMIRIFGPINMHDDRTWLGHIDLAESPGIYANAYTDTYNGLVLFTVDKPVFPPEDADNLNGDFLLTVGLPDLFVRESLYGNDQFTMRQGTHLIDGYDGYNTVTEISSYASYTVSHSSAALLVNGAGSSDTLYNIQGVYFSDGFYNTQSATFSPASPAFGFSGVDTTTRGPAPGAPQAYSGSVVGVQKEYAAITSDSLNITAASDNWFIHTGSGTDAIEVQGGTNVLDGGQGSNFLVAGNGLDTFFVDDRNTKSDIWSTVVGFQPGDTVTIWGATPQGPNASWLDGAGAAGYTGLTLNTAAPGAPAANLTLAGLSTHDLYRLAVSYGSASGSGSNYLTIRANLLPI